MNTLQSYVKQLQNGSLSPEEFLQKLTLFLVQEVQTTRASLWLFNEYKDSLECLMLFDTRTAEFSSGIQLYAEDFPQYFLAMSQGDTISAVDAQRHPLTACFGENYFDPLDIKSLLDVSITAKGEVVGVVCCENCEFRKEWTEKNIETLQATAVTMALGLNVLKNALQQSFA